MKKSTITPFEMGYHWGEEGGKELTPRKIMKLFPEIDILDIDAFRQGVLDGIAGDTFRLDLQKRLGLTE